MNQLLDKDRAPSVLPDLDDKSSAESLSVYFTGKIEKIQESFSAAAVSAASPVEVAPLSGQPLSQFVPVTEENRIRLARKSMKTYSTVDLMPTRMVLELSSILLLVIVKLIYGSLESGVVAECFVTAIIKLLLKKPNLDPNTMKNYRPVSNLPFISKLLDHVVTEQLVIHLNENHLLDKFHNE